ncbi:hypothetical protein [Staphylococcus phage SAPYZU_15]|nr:hypothetical protein [Staphylococcus phage SAPYZU_15]
MTNLNQMKAIKVKHIDNENRVTTSYISHEQFKTSFVDERWQGERRTDKQHTMFGHYHTKTTVTSPYGQKSVRVFDFPSNVKDAEERHNRHEADMQARFKLRKDNTRVRILWTLAKKGYFDYRTVHNIFKNESEDYIIFNSAQSYNKFRELENNTSAIS